MEEGEIIALPALRLASRPFWSLDSDVAIHSNSRQQLPNGVKLLFAQLVASQAESL